MDSLWENINKAELRQIIRELIADEMKKMDESARVKSKGKLPAKCKHGKQTAFCKECGGSALCKHGKQKAFCFECGGSQMCMHRRRKYLCKECKNR